MIAMLNSLITNNVNSEEASRKITKQPIRPAIQKRTIVSAIKLNRVGLKNLTTPHIIDTADKRDTKIR